MNAKQERTGETRGYPKVLHLLIGSEGRNKNRREKIQLLSVAYRGRIWDVQTPPQIPLGHPLTL